MLLVFVLSRFAHHGEYLALDLSRQCSDAVQISRFHQICRLYRCDGQGFPILINRYTTGQNNSNTHIGVKCRRSSVRVTDVVHPALTLKNDALVAERVLQIEHVQDAKFVTLNCLRKS